MIVKEEKHNNNNLKYNTICLEKCFNNFIILNDNSVKINDEFESIINGINKYDFNLVMIDSKTIMKNIINYLDKNNLNDCFDTVVLAGSGGKQMYEGIKNLSFFDDKDVLEIIWHRIWNDETSLGFETNIDKYNLKNKKVIIIEDVIASGNTLWTLKSTLEKLGAKVIYIISALIQESSPIIEKSFSKVYSSIMIEKPKDSTLDPFWYPPIYSLRHLLYGDSEMPNFYKILNSKYFNNSNSVELLIKSYRKDI